MRGFRVPSRPRRQSTLVGLALFVLVVIGGASCGGQPGSGNSTGLEAATGIPAGSAPDVTLPVFDEDRTDLDPGDPPEQLDEALIDATLPSAVQVTGDGCTRLQLGSGFVVAAETVVTNAHVVAGVADVEVRTRTGAFDAEVIGFDPEADIAILRVAGLVLPSLEMADGVVDDEGVILGFGGGRGSDTGSRADPDPDPFRINRLITATGENIYRDTGEVRRAAYLVAAEIEPGDSGAALVRTDGVVVGMAFAASKRANAAYAVRSSEIQTRLENPTIEGDQLRCAKG